MPRKRKTAPEVLPRVNQEQIALVFAVTPAAVSQWRSEGPEFPEPGADGLFDIAEVGAWHDRYRRRSRDFHVAQARKVSAAADAREMEVEKMKSQLIPRSQVEQQWQAYQDDKAETVQASMRGLSRRLAGCSASSVLKRLEKWWEDVSDDLAKRA